MHISGVAEGDTGIGVQFSDRTFTKSKEKLPANLLKGWLKDQLVGS